MKKRIIKNLTAVLLLFAMCIGNSAVCSAFSEESFGKRSFLIGDADCDNRTTILDVTVIQRYIASFSINQFDSIPADFDNDGAISILDATRLQFYLLYVTDERIVEYSQQNEPVKEYDDQTN